MAHLHTLENGETIIRDDWTADDVRNVAETALTDAQVMEVMRRVVSGFDANFGITWDHVHNAIEGVLC